MTIHYSLEAPGLPRAVPGEPPCGTDIERDQDGELWYNATNNPHAVDCTRCLLHGMLVGYFMEFRVEGSLKTQGLASQLVRESMYFEVTPLPVDVYRIRVKEDAAPIVRDLLCSPVEEA